MLLCHKIPSMEPTSASPPTSIGKYVHITRRNGIENVNIYTIINTSTFLIAHRLKMKNDSD